MPVRLRLTPALTALALFAPLAAAPVGAAGAQDTPGGRPAARPTAPTAPDARATRLGVLGGWNSATFTGPDADEAGDTERRNGFVLGAYLVRPIGTGALAFRPELLIAQKGAGVRVRDPDFGDLEAGIELTYFELPLLLEWRPAVTSGVRPFVHGGPTLSLRTGCRARLRAFGESVSADCDDAGEDGFTTAGVRRFDYGALVGGGLRFTIGGTEAAVGARFQQGFRNLARDPEFREEVRVRNRVVAVYGALEFPLARRR